MPKLRSGQFDQDKYVREYLRENRTTKNITFNKRNPDDMKMLEWINSQEEGANKYVKRLVREDMEENANA